MIIEPTNNLSIKIIELFSIDKINSESYVRDIFESYGYKVTKKNGSPKGIPDFFCEKGGEKFYVEVKGDNDSLRISQIEWIKDNFDKPVILFIVKRISEKKINHKKNKGCSKCKRRRQSIDLTIFEDKTICHTCLRKILAIRSIRKTIPLSNKHEREILKLPDKFRSKDVIEIISKDIK